MELLPDSKLAAEVEAKEKDRLAQAKAQMTPEQIQAVIKETQELKLRQVIGDAPAHQCSCSLLFSMRGVGTATHVVLSSHPHIDVFRSANL